MALLPSDLVVGHRPEEDRGILNAKFCGRRHVAGDVVGERPDVQHVEIRIRCRSTTRRVSDFEYRIVFDHRVAADLGVRKSVGQAGRDGGFPGEVHPLEVDHTGEKLGSGSQRLQLG